MFKVSEMGSSISYNEAFNNPQLNFNMRTYKEIMVEDMGLPYNSQDATNAKSVGNLSNKLDNAPAYDDEVDDELSQYDPSEVGAGLEWENGRTIRKDHYGAKLRVLHNLQSDKNYYSNLDQFPDVDGDEKNINTDDEDDKYDDLGSDNGKDLDKDTDNEVDENVDYSQTPERMNETLRMKMKRRAGIKDENLGRPVDKYGNNENLGTPVSKYGNEHNRHMEEASIWGSPEQNKKFLKPGCRWTARLKEMKKKGGAWVPSGPEDNENPEYPEEDETDKETRKNWSTFADVDKVKAMRASQQRHGGKLPSSWWNDRPVGSAHAKIATSHETPTHRPLTPTDYDKPEEPIDEIAPPNQLPDPSEQPGEGEEPPLPYHLPGKKFDPKTGNVPVIPNPYGDFDPANPDGVNEVDEPSAEEKEKILKALFARAGTGAPPAGSQVSHPEDKRSFYNLPDYQKSIQPKRGEEIRPIHPPTPKKKKEEEEPPELNVPLENIGKNSLQLLRETLTTIYPHSIVQSRSNGIVALRNEQYEGSIVGIGKDWGQFAVLVLETKSGKECEYLPLVSRKDLEKTLNPYFGNKNRK